MWEVSILYTFLIVLLVIVCISLIAVVYYNQAEVKVYPAPFPGVLNNCSANKSQGLDLILQRITVCISSLVFVLTFLLTYLKL